MSSRFISTNGCPIVDYKINYIKSQGNIVPKVNYSSIISINSKGKFIML
jgi:hypothetical protein